MTRYAYIGTYTQTSPGGPHREQGIYLYRIEPTSGNLSFVSAFESGPNPSFLVLNPDRSFLYSVNEMSEGAASAFSVNPQTGELKRLNSQTTLGADPCYLSLDPSGRWLMISNYSSGSLVVLPVRDDGSLELPSDFVQHRGFGPNLQRQETAHAHSIRFDPSGRFVLAADLGMDRLFVYSLDQSHGRLQSLDPNGVILEPGSGPRHFDFHPNGRFLYIANELSSTVTACNWIAEEGTILPFQSLSSLPADFSGENQVADIHIHPSGHWLFVSNRGHNSLAAFAVDGQSGKMSPAGHTSTQGEWPRNFAIDPSGMHLYVANQNSDSLVHFQLDTNTGQLIPSGQIVSIPAPVCVKIIDL